MAIWLAAIIPAGCYYACVNQHDSVLANLRNIYPKALDYLPLLLLQIIIVFFWSGYFTGYDYHIMVRINNDIFFWGMMADHIFGVSDLNRIVYGEKFISQTNDCFGAYSWLGLLSQISLKSHAVETAQIFVLSLTTLISWVVYDISSKNLLTHRCASLIIALVFVFNPLTLTIITNGFLSQLIQTFCFLSVIFIISQSSQEESSTGKIFYSAIITSGFLLSYPGLSPLYFAFIILAIGLLNIIQSKSRQNTITVALFYDSVLNAIGIMIGVCLFYDIAYHAAQRLIELSGVNAGWSLSMLDIRNLFGLPTSVLDHTVFSTWPVYALATISLGILLIVRIRKTHQHAAETRLNWLLSLALIALVGYECVYLLKGSSYQQWKFATYFPLPLLLVAIPNIIAPKKFVQCSSVTIQALYIIFCATLGFQLFLAAKLDDLQITTNKSIKELIKIDQSEFNALTLDLPPYRETMLAMNFLGHSKLSSIAESYIKVSNFNPAGISQSNPLLTSIYSRFADDDCKLKNAGKDYLLLTKLDPYILTSVVGESYYQESDGRNWWHWVKTGIKFKVDPFLFADNRLKTRVRFEYITRGPQTITIRINLNDMPDMVFHVFSQGRDTQVYEDLLDLPPTRINYVEISSDGKPSPLSSQDTRIAAWMIRNLRLTTVH